MLGPRKIDPLALRLLDIEGSLRRAGAMRRLAELFAAEDPSIACVHQVDSGDAFAFATRFDRDWGYSGGMAVFWVKAIRALGVHDHYAPTLPLRPFDRRAVLHVNAVFEDEPLSILATTLGDERGSRVRDMRFMRSVLRRVPGAAIAFIGNAASSPAAFVDLNFSTLSRGDHNLIVVRPSHATPPPQTAGSQAASANIVRI